MPAEVLVPFIVMSAFLAVMALMILWAIRRSRRGFAWEERSTWSDDDRR